MNGTMVILAVAVACLVAGVSGCIMPGTRSIETVTLHYQMTSGQEIDVMNSNGNIHIVAYNGSNLTVQAKKMTYGGSGDLKNINVSIVEENNHVRIRTVFTGSSISPQRQVDYTISVPRNVSVGAVSTSNNQITVSGVRGDVVASTSNAQILIENVDGFVSASTSNAHIGLTGTSGIAHVQTSNAAINTEVFGLANSTVIQTSNAAITISILPTLNATLDLQTSDSSIHTSGVPLVVTTSEGNHLVGTLGSGGKHLTVQTSNAEIIVNAVGTI